jgi:divalent metal cation (Fe/Co/Zn/Cd) transporter
VTPGWTSLAVDAAIPDGHLDRSCLTAGVMFALAYGKTRTGAALGNPVLTTEGRVTVIDGVLAVAVLAGLVLNAAFGWWWADPAAGYVLVYYAARESWAIRADLR